MAGVAVLCAITVLAAPSPVVAPWDVLVLLDGSYRMTLGQVPGVDFANPVGPMVYGLTSTGMAWQERPSLAAVAYGNVLFVVIATSLAWYCTRDRLRPAWRAGGVLFLALMLVSVRPLGYSPFTTSYAMLYNRYGWALLTIAAAAVLIDPGRPAAAARRAGRLDAFTLGLLLGLAAYTKVTFAVAVLVLVVYFCLRTDSLPRALAAAAGVVVVVAACFLAWGVDPASYLSDVLAAGRVQSGHARLAQLIRESLWSAPALLTILLLAVVLALSTRAAHLPRGQLLRLGATVAGLAAAALVLTVGDAEERGELPLLALVPVLVVSSGVWRAATRVDGRARRVARFAAPGALALVVLATAGRPAAADGVGLAVDVTHHAMIDHPPASQRIDAPGLSDFVIPANAGWQTAYRTAKDLPAMINDGLGLLHGRVAPKDRVFTLAYGNPFNMALGLVPTRGGLLWYDLGYDVDAEHFPAPDTALGDAQWVMVPRMVPGEGCCQSTVDAMKAVYGPYLRSTFTPVAQSSSWELWRRTVPRR
jgi:hypothetical protein